MLIVKFCSVAVTIAAIVFAQSGPAIGSPARASVGRPSTCSPISWSRRLSASFGRDRSWSGQRSWRPRCYRRPAALTPDRHANFRPGCTAQAGHSRRLCWLSFLSELLRGDPAEGSEDSRGAGGCCLCGSIACAAAIASTYRRPRISVHVAADAVAGGLRTFGYGKGEVVPPRRSAGPPWSARSARPRRRRCGDQGHQSALRSNGLRRDLQRE